MLSTMDDDLVEGAEEYSVTLTFIEQFGSFTPTAGGDRAVIVIMDDDCKYISTLVYISLIHTYTAMLASFKVSWSWIACYLLLGQCLSDRYYRGSLKIRYAVVIHKCPIFKGWG